MINKIRLILTLMNPCDKKQLALIALIGVLDSIINVVGIASILPFISVISEPNLINTNEYIIEFKHITGIDTQFGVILSFGLFSFFMILMANVIGGLDAWFSLKFSYFKEKELGEKLLLNYLSIDELSFNKKNIPEAIKNILTEIDRVILDTLFACLEMLSNFLMAVLIFSMLLFLDVLAAIVITAILLSVYLVIYHFSSDKLEKLGREFSDIETDIYQGIMNPLSFRQEIKLTQTSDYYLKCYERSFTKMIKNRLNFEILTLIPQQLVEIMSFGTIIFLAIYFVMVDTSDLVNVAILSVYAFAAYRLLPAIGDIFDNFEQVRFGSAVLVKLIDEFKVDKMEPLNNKEQIKGEQKLYAIRKALDIKNISFRYSENSDFVLNDLSFKFEANYFYSIKGTTGSGKSTLLKIIAGLYPIEKGDIEIDGNEGVLFENPDWFSKIAYVPTKINMIKGTIEQNIAFGLEPEEIDSDRLKQCAALTLFSEDVLCFPDGFRTRIGEGGVGLSSGQLQKLGLTRALYRDTKLLLLDEISDSFDLDTEYMILKNLSQLKDTTIIFISHRPSVHKFADKTIDLELINMNRDGSGN